MNNRKDISELGRFKNKIHNALYRSDGIKEVLLGDVSGKSAAEIRKLFKEHVKSHLFVDETITETQSYIFYDVGMSFMRENIKTCTVMMYVVCHRDILDDYAKEGYYGNRADIIAQMVEDCLISDKQVSMDFGIGELKLDSIEPFNGRYLYGCCMTFSVPDFR